MARILIFFLAAAVIQANAGPLDLNPINWIFKGPQIGLEMASGVLGEVQSGLNKAGVGSLAAGPLNVMKASLDVPAGMIGQVKDRTNGFSTVFQPILSMPQQIVNQAATSTAKVVNQVSNDAQKQFQNALNTIQSQYPQLTNQEISHALQQAAATKAQTPAKPQPKPQPAEPELTEEELEEELQVVKEEIDDRLGFIIQNISNHVKLEQSRPGVTDDVKARFAKQEQLILNRANELMSQCWSSNTVEEAMEFFTQMENEFGTMFYNARLALAQTE